MDLNTINKDILIEYKNKMLNYIELPATVVVGIGAVVYGSSGAITVTLVLITKVATTIINNIFITTESLYIYASIEILTESSVAVIVAVAFLTFAAIPLSGSVVVSLAGMIAAPCIAETLLSLVIVKYRTADLATQKPDSLSLETPGEIFKDWQKTSSGKKGEVLLTNAYGRTLSLEVKNLTEPGSLDTSSLAIVNAANSKMKQGGGGTNAAITQVVSDDSWNSSREGKADLKTGEATIGQWINRQGGAPKASHLIQALGPKFDQSYLHADGQLDESKIQETFSILYANILSACARKGVENVQLPLIGSGIFAPSDPVLKEQWNLINARCLALAAKNVLDDPKSTLKRIIVVNLGQAWKFEGLN